MTELKQSLDVADGEQDHDQKQERETEAIDPCFHFLRNGGAFYLFNDDHKESAAIERRKWNEIHDGEVERYDAKQLDEIDRADLPRFFGGTKDPDRPHDASKERAVHEKISDELPQDLEDHSSKNN